MKKNAIINAAIEEFGKYDYDRASINSIIERSGTSKGTFYHYFKSKEDLYLELISIVAKEKLDFMSGKTGAASNIENYDNIFEVLKSQIGASVRFTLAYPEYAAFSGKAANETNYEIRKKVQSLIGNTTNEFFNQLIKTNIEKKNLRSDIPDEFVSQIFVYMIGHFSDFLLSSGVKVEANFTDKIMEYLKYYIDFLENGIGCKK